MTDDDFGRQFSIFSERAEEAKSALGLRRTDEDQPDRERRISQNEIEVRLIGMLVDSLHLAASLTYSLNLEELERRARRLFESESEVWKEYQERQKKDDKAWEEAWNQGRERRMSAAEIMRTRDGLSF